MAITLNGTTGITTDGGYVGDGVLFADGTPSNTLVTSGGGGVGIGTSPGAIGRLQVLAFANSTSLVLTDGTQSTLQINHDDANILTYRTLGGAIQRWVMDVNERMRLYPSGILMVGTTGSLASGYIFNANGFFQHCRPSGSAQSMTGFYNGGNFVGEIRTTTVSTSYITSSDYRLKENVTPMTGALAKVAQLKPVTYNWKSNGSAGQGFIAHELQAIVPDCVSGEKDAVDADGKPEYQGVDTSFLVATLVAAIQEQQTIIQSLTARIEALEAV